MAYVELPISVFSCSFIIMILAFASFLVQKFTENDLIVTLSTMEIGLNVCFIIGYIQLTFMLHYVLIWTLLFIIKVSFILLCVTFSHGLELIRRWLPTNIWPRPFDDESIDPAELLVNTTVTPGPSTRSRIRKCSTPISTPRTSRKSKVN